MRNNDSVTLIFYVGGKNKILVNKLEKCISPDTGSGPAIPSSGLFQLRSCAVGVELTSVVLYAYNYFSLYFADEFSAKKEENYLLLSISSYDVGNARYYRYYAYWTIHTLFRRECV